MIRGTDGHRALKPLVSILLTNDCHDFDDIPVDSIIDTIYTAHAASVTFAVLAAVCAAGLIRNHPFVDGNKRIGFMAAYMFLDLNGATLEADEVSATAMTLSLAASEVEEDDYARWLTESIQIA